MHMDMDAFYAAVEVHDDPSLQGKPLIIGALPTERGVVSTCSYEARKFGVHSGMSIKEAYKLCPQGIYMHGHFQRYREISQKVHEILLSYTDQIEFIALDEGYLDITNSLSLFGTPEKIGRQIKDRVLQTTGLTCSVGIGYNKMTAKLSSEEKKPDGFFRIRNEKEFMELMIDRPVRILPGIGPKAASFLHERGIDTLRQLHQLSKEELATLFGSSGEELYERARGRGSAHVKHLGEGEAKSISKEVTYQKDMTDPKDMLSTLHLLCRSLSRSLLKHHFFAQTVTLKIKYQDLTLNTRSLTPGGAIQSAQALYEVAESLLLKAPLKKPVRLLGVGTSHFTSAPIYQLTIEEGDALYEQEKKREKLSRSLSSLYDKYGRDIVLTAGDLDSLNTLTEHDIFDS